MKVIINSNNVYVTLHKMGNLAMFLFDNNRIDELSRVVLALIRKTQNNLHKI